MGAGEGRREGIGRGEVGRLEKERWSRGSDDQLAVMRWASATYSQVSEIDYIMVFYYIISGFS